MGESIKVVDVITANLCPELKSLMLEATSEQKVDAQYLTYINNPNWFLYEWQSEAAHICCIGVEIEGDSAEIKQIATAKPFRKMGWGHRMLEFIKIKHKLKKITAETDLEAVGFYSSEGFRIESLGEKYPGVERFLCTWRLGGFEDE